MRTKILIGYIFLGVAGVVRGQQKELELDPVTVTAGLREQRVSVSGRNIVTVSGSQFEKLPVHSVDELLRYVPGVEVQQRGPMGSQADFVLRGGTFQQVLVVLDGLRLNDPNSGHFSGYIPIDPSEIDRIEVLKGAASAIYGSDAVGGVIHIITRTFVRRLEGEKLRLNGTVTGGTYGLFNGNLGGSYSRGGTVLSVGLVSNNADGQPQRGADGYFHNLTASFAFSHVFDSSFRLSFRTSVDRRDFSAQNFYTTLTSDTAQETVSSWWSQLALQYHKGDNGWTLAAGLKKVEDRYAFNSLGIPNNNRSQMAQVTGRFEHRFSNLINMVAGIQLQDRSIRSNDRGDHVVGQQAGFLILNAGSDRLLVSPALRVDHDELAGTNWVPQLNLSYRFDAWQFRASGGRTIRTADFTERFNNYNKALVTGGSVGNPGLAPETSFSYEAGVDFFPAHWLRVSSTFFNRDQRDVIDWVATAYSDMPRKDNLSPTGSFALASNIASVLTRGVEMDVQVAVPLPRENKLRSALGAVWLDSHLSSGAGSFYIASHAKWLLNGSLQWESRRLLLSVTALYKYRTPMQAAAIAAATDRDYFVLNAKASFFPGGKLFSVFVAADNLLDRSYSDLLGAVMPGRWVSGGIHINFFK